MNSNRTPLVIIGGIVVIAIIGIVAYAASQNGTPQASQHEHGESTQQAAGTGDAVSTDSVTIQNYAYSPAAIKVKVGTKVTWTNQDDVKHTVTVDDEAGGGPKSGLFGKGETFSYVFDETGTYDYYCQPHPYMKGTVVVTE